MEHGFPLPRLLPGASPTQNCTEDNHSAGPIKIKRAIFQEAEERGKQSHPLAKSQPGVWD